MAVSVEQFLAELRAFEARKVIVKELRKSIRKPVPELRKKIRERATSTLPKGGGLNKWVAKTRMSAQIKVSSRTVSVKVKGGRNSLGGRSDVNAIDRGRLRAPSWGRRGKGDWHTQAVTPGFWSESVDDIRGDWLNVIERAVDDATATIREGR